MTKTFEQQEVIEKAEHMKLWAQLSKARCAECKHDKTVECGCEASTRLKEITENWKGKVKVVLPENGGICFKDGVITVDKYEQAKKQMIADTTIQNQLGWHGMKMNKWKRDNGLLGKSIHKVEPKSEVESVAPTLPMFVPTESEYYKAPLKELEQLKAEHERLKAQYEELEVNYQAEKEKQEISEAAAVKSVQEHGEAMVKVYKNHKEELKTAEHYFKQAKDSNVALQAQVDRLAKQKNEIKTELESLAYELQEPKGDWRLLEQQIKEGKVEYDKLARDYDNLDERFNRQTRTLDSFIKESDRVNELNTMLMLNTLKIVERAGDMA